MAISINSINADTLKVSGSTLTRVTANAASACCCPSCGGLECLDRTRYFPGQLVKCDDLNNEQSYWLAKSRLHNRYLVGWGVVCGMQVTRGECDGWVVVQPGYAIDPCGNDIIVCEAQNFNVLKAIQECCAPVKKQPVNCSPLRYNPAPACKESKQEWCITLRYREQASRMVTPLTKATSQSTGNCSCACGCDASSSAASSSSSLSPSCEPTRIVEGFELGVVLASEVAAALVAADPYSLKSQLEQCLAGLVLLSEQGARLSDYATYTAVCNYYTAVQRYFADNATLTRCAILDELASIKIEPVKDSDRELNYTWAVAALRKITAKAFWDCLCYALVPPCKPAPCDDRIVLGCVTIQNGKILNICHFPGRQQVVTLQTLGYWLGPFGLDNIKLAMETLLAVLCCKTNEDERDPITFNNDSVYDNEAITTAGLTSGATVNRLISHYFAQAIGAQAVNALNPNAQAVDLHTLVNQDAKTATTLLNAQGFKQVTVKPVDGDPSWTADAVDASAQFAPSAVSTSQPLVVYTKGGVVVGLDVVDPTTAKIQDLQSQIDALKSQLSPSAQTTSNVTTTTDKS
jgi:hypothetical protein